MKKLFQILLALCVACSMLCPIVQAAPAPAAPKNLKAIALSWDSIQLSWDATSRADGYELYYLSNGKYVFMQEVPTNTYIDNEISYEQTKYTYKVRAFTISDGNKIYSAFSATASAISCAYIPAIVETMSDTTIRLSWSDNSDASGYEIYRAKKNGKYSLIQTTVQTNILDIGLKPSVTYTYQIRYFTTKKGKKIRSTFSPVYTAKTLPAGKKYSYYLFIGNSMIYYPRTEYYFQQICDSQNQYVRTMQDVIGGSGLSDHIKVYKEFINPMYRQANYVILMGYPVWPDNSLDTIKEVKKFFPKETEFIDLPVYPHPTSPAEIEYYLLRDLGIPILKTLEMSKYLFNKHADELFRLSINDIHPNELYGYASALLMYCQLYHADPTYISHDCVRPEIIPGDTKVEKDAFMNDIKEAVKKVLNE